MTARLYIQIGGRKKMDDILHMFKKASVLYHNLLYTMMPSGETEKSLKELFSINEKLLQYVKKSTNADDEEAKRITQKLVSCYLEAYDFVFMQSRRRRAV